MAGRYACCMEISPVSAGRLTQEAKRWQLKIRAGERSDHSVHLMFASGDHLAIDIGEGASVTFIEKRLGTSSDVWMQDVVLDVQPRSHVTYIAALKHRKAILKHCAIIHREAAIHWHVATLGGSIDHTVQSNVAGEGGKSDIDWIFYASDRDDQKLIVQNEFAARNGGGEITMRGVAQDRAHVAARGKIAIGSEGSGTDTYLSQSVLMLDPSAKIDAIPALEIKTNDVKASHSAAVARVSPEDLFYFGARGIPEHEARGMYIEGFLGELVGRIPEEEARQKILAAIQGSITPSRE